MDKPNYTTWSIDEPHGKTVAFWVAESRRGIAKGADPLEALGNLLTEESVQCVAEWTEMLDKEPMITVTIDRDRVIETNGKTAKEVPP